MMTSLPYGTAAWAEETEFVEAQAEIQTEAPTTETTVEAETPQAQEQATEPAAEPQTAVSEPETPEQTAAETAAAEAPTEEKQTPQEQATEAAAETQAATEAEEQTRGDEEEDVSADMILLKAAPQNDSTFEITFNYGSDCVDLEEGNPITQSNAVEIEATKTMTDDEENEWWYVSLDDVEAAYDRLSASQKAKSEGRKLVGWEYKLNGSMTELTIDSVLTDDAVVYAVWEDVNKFDATFVYGDGCENPANGNPITSSGKISFTSDETDDDETYYYDGTTVKNLYEGLAESKKAEKYGYSLSGWEYDGEDGAYGLEDSDKFYSSMTFRAIWTKNPLTVQEAGNGRITVSNGSAEKRIPADATVLDLAKAVYEVASNKELPDEPLRVDAGETENKLRARIEDDEDASDWFAPEDGTELILYGKTDELIRFMLLENEEEGGMYAVEEEKELLDLFTITYNLNYDGAETPDRVSVRKEDEAIGYFDVEDPERDGYRFAGWFYGTDEEADQASVHDCLSEDAVLYAGWVSENAYRITYELNDEESSSVTFYGEEIGTNAVNGKAVNGDDFTTVEGKMFLGWFGTDSDSDDVDLTGEAPDKAVEKDEDAKTATVYAHWADPLMVTFCDENGEAYYYLDQIRLPDGGTIAKYAPEGYEMPTPNATPGMTFAGWYLNGEGERISLETPIDGSAAENGTVKLLAKWADSTSTVTFDPNGGSLENPSEATRIVAEGSAVGTFPNAYREGYDLDGWFDEAEGGNQIFAGEVPSGETTYYAHWTKTAETVTSITLPAIYMTVGTVDELKTLYEDYSYAPETAENASFVWSSSNEGVIRISDASAGTSWTNPFEYVSDGETWLTLSTQDGKVSARCRVKITKPDEPIPHTEKIDVLLDGSVVTGTTIEIGFGENPQLASDPNDPTFVWKSSNEGVLSVEGGKVRTKSAGTAKVTVEAVDGSASASVTVKVNEAETNAEFLRFVNPGPTEITIGDSVDLAVEYGSLHADDAQLEWHSSNPDVIAVTADGEKIKYSFEGSYGEVIITVSTPDGKLTASKTFVVKEKNSVDWTPDKDTYYTISFDSRGGSEVLPARVKSGSQVALPSPTRDGYSFDGWYMERESAMTKVTSLAAERDLTLYAGWIENPKPETVEITFDKRNGEDAVRITVEKGSAIGAFPTAERQGYTLIGWFTDDEGGAAVESDMTVSKDSTFYAHWLNDAENGRFVLTLDPNGGNVDGSPKPVVPDEKLVRGTYVLNDVSAWTPYRPGFEFKGWRDAREDGTLVYSADGKAVAGTEYWPTASAYAGEKDLNVYAEWEKTPETFELNFDARGGKTVKPARYEVGATVSEFPTTEREGYRFLGWFLEATAGDPIDSVVMKGNMTIYAQWEMIDDDPEKGPFTLSFDAQGGTPAEPVTGEAGTEVNPLPETAREKYSFVGWFDKEEGGVRLLSFTLDHDATLYAHWEKDLSKVKKYVVRFDWMNGGTVTETVNFTDDEGNPSTMTEFPTPKRDGFEFEGWFTRPEGGEKVESYSGSEDAEFYAHWKDVRPIVEIIRTIEFHPQDGKTQVWSTEAKDGASVPLPEMTREGYAFNGWFTLPSGGTKIESLIADRNYKLYGSWTFERIATATYEVTFDPQNGDEPSKIEGRAYNDGTYDVIVSFPEPTWEGRSFLGWYTGKADGVKVKSYSGEEDVTLYAHWKNEAEEEEPVQKRSYSLTFSTYGGTKVAPIAAEEGTVISEESLPTTSKSGYEFLGWYLSKDGNEKAASVKMDGNVRLHAHWAEKTAETYEVVLDFANGERAEAIETKVGKAFRFPKPQNEGYEFTGWYDENGTKVTAYVGEAGSSVTFTAKWTAVKADSRKVAWILLSRHELTVKEGEDLNITYNYGPKGAPNAQFVWSSSNPKVLEVISSEKDGVKVQSLKYNGTGVAYVSISTKDGTESDTCKVTVTEAEPEDGSSDPSTPKKGRGTVISTPRGSGRAITGLGSASGYDGGDDDEEADETSGERSYGASSAASETEDAKISLTIRSGDAAVKKVSVKKEVTLQALTKKLGYEASSWKVRTPSEEPRNISSAATMRTLEKMADAGEIVISAYGEEGAVGAAKVSRNSDGKFSVAVAKDRDEMDKMETDTLESYPEGAKALFENMKMKAAEAVESFSKNPDEKTSSYLMMAAAFAAAPETVI